MVDRLTFHRYYIPLYLWALPATLVGLLLAIAYRAHSFRWSQGCLEAVSSHIFFHPTAQTHGFLIFYESEAARNVIPMRVHERIHVIQGFVGGPFFMLAYALDFFQGFVRRGFKNWQGAYRQIVFERQAYRLQGTEGAWGS